MDAIAPLGHAGHWITSVVYFAPVVGFLAWLTFITVRERMGRGARSEDEPGPT